MEAKVTGTLASLFFQRFSQSCLCASTSQGTLGRLLQAVEAALLAVVLLLALRLGVDE